MLIPLYGFWSSRFKPKRWAISGRTDSVQIFLGSKVGSGYRWQPPQYTSESISTFIVCIPVVSGFHTSDACSAAEDDVPIQDDTIPDPDRNMINKEIKYNDPELPGAFFTGNIILKFNPSLLSGKIIDKYTIYTDRYDHRSTGLG